MRVDILTHLGHYVAFLSDLGVYKIFLPNALAQAEAFGEQVDQGQRSFAIEQTAELLLHEMALYHDGKLREFSVPVSPNKENVSPFRFKVWQVMQNIPYGETWSYGDLAKVVGSTSGRAIGGACSSNPAPLLIPCHRVIASNGTLGGFSGGKYLKKKLLDMEKSSITNTLTDSQSHTE